MSLPPGFLDELRTRSSLTSVVGRKVTWDMRKSNQAKGDMWAPCPFHQEKTASFHVDDRKGFYHCFGCHAKGDAITFVRETENVGFMEAVEILAQEAGMQLPERDPQAKEKSDRRAQVADVMEQAVRFFRLQIKTAAASEARDYITRRGLDETALERWEIGYAPDAWQALWDHLKSKEIPDDLILDAGLAKPSSRGGRPYDTFRGRIIFPIRDARGRAIAFGGRAMDPEDKAKYLNSPETLLFDKGATLFNHGPARTAAGRGLPLVVAEGYMDVIALAEHGFEAAVAPLGTAVTETQLQMLWRISPEPIIALDGDTAGLRAAMRLIDLALPLLVAGQSLRFALMPDGQDPDDVLRAGGAGALQKIIDAAQPMAQLLWQRETEGRVFDSPERKAALEKALRDKTALIKDPSIRSHYEKELRNQQWNLFRPNDGGRRQQPKRARAMQVSKTSELARYDGRDADIQLQERIILAGLLRHPQLIEKYESELERLKCDDPFLRDVLDAFLAQGGSRSDVAAKMDHLFGADLLEKLIGRGHLFVNPLDRVLADPEKARHEIEHKLSRLNALSGLRQETKEAEEDLDGDADEGLTWRLGEAARAAAKAVRNTDEDKAEYEIGANGARISRDEQNALNALLRTIKQEKPLG
ncbi:MAG: DNA primase [Roseobacter sp.]